jgi:cytochrome b
MTLGVDKHAGPLALLYNSEPAGTTGSSGAEAVRTSAARVQTGETGASESEKREESAFREVHEVLANLTLILVAFHLGGVVLASILHRENLVLAMITGRKRADIR